jgi:hypothetical protein
MSLSLWLTIIGAAFTFVGAVVGAFKEKHKPDAEDAQRKRIFKWVTVFIFIASFVTTCVISVDSERSKAVSGGQITELNNSIATLQSVNKTQHEQDLVELQRVNSQLSDLKTGIATEELRKKMSVLQSELDQYLKSNPKIELESGLWTSQNDPLVSELYIPVEGTKAKFEVGLRNETPTYAKNVEMWVMICRDCKFSSEPKNSIMLPENGPQMRYWRGISLATKVSYNATVEIDVPRPYTEMSANVRYTCENCLQTSDKALKLALGRTGLPFLQSPAKKISSKPARKP